MEAVTLLEAMDEYLAKQGHGDGYIAKKLTSIFEDEESVMNLERGPLNSLKEKIKTLSDTIEEFSNDQKDISKKLKDINKNLKLSTFKKMNEMANKVSGYFKNFSSSLKGLASFEKKLSSRTVDLFFQNMHNINVLMRRKRIDMVSGQPRERAVGGNDPLKIKIMDLDNTLINKLKNVFGGKDVRATAFDQNNNYKEEEGIVSKILKGVVGSIALLAGIGFISEFLDKTPQGRIIKKALGKIADKAVEMLTPFVKKLFDMALVGLGKLFVDLPIYIAKQSFNFFGLKEKFGEEYQGVAVFLTKRIAQTIFDTLFKLANIVTFGGLSKSIESIGKMFSSIGKSILNFDSFKASVVEKLKPIKEFFPMISKKVGNFIKNIIAVPKYLMGLIGLDKVTNFLGIATKTKMVSGGLFKLAGTSLKFLAKRLWIVGTAISFKDAYDRWKQGQWGRALVSIASGIANIFPVVGAVLSTGLDFFNMFLDQKYSEPTGEQIKPIGNWMKSLWDKVVSSVTWFFDKIVNMFDITGIGRKMWNYITGNSPKEITPESLKMPEDVETDVKTPRTSRRRSGRTPIKVNDAIIGNDKVVIPNRADDVVLTKTGGPFDVAFKNMNNNLEQLSKIFAEGVAIIASTTSQGSSNVVNAIAATAGSKESPVGGPSYDNIADYRIRAERAIENLSR